MKKILMFLVFVVLSVYCAAQAPQKFSYQAVIRNSNGDLVTDKDVGVRLTILQGSPTGVPVWIETYSPNPHTNVNGLVTIEIGGSNPLSIDFSSGGPYFLKTETDPSGGTDYTISGTSELLSVPYALHAKSVASYPESDPVFHAWDKSTGININNTQINNWSGATSAFLTGITSDQVTTALGFNPYNSSNPSGYTSNTGTVTSVALSAPTGFSVSGTPVTNSGTLNLTLSSGYAIPTTDQLFPGLGTTVDKAAYGSHTHDYSGVYAALTHNHNGIYEPVIIAGTVLQYWRGDKSWQTLNTTAVSEGTNLYFNNTRARAAISLTTIGNSGAATYSSGSGEINIPNYTLSGLSGQPALNGTGLVRMSGTTVTYDNNTYLTSYTETQNLTNVLTLGTDAGNKKIVNISQVGIGTGSPAASAAIEINSTTQGFLLPRMTSEQINALTPVEGLLVYNITSNNLTYYGNGKWYELTNKVCFPDPTPANAGPDKIVGTASTTLAGNTPVFGTGTWTIVEGIGGIIADIHNPASVFTGTLGAGYVLKWTISTPCSSSADNVIISLGPTCSNGILDGTESDVDCGGGSCTGCGGSMHCNTDSDCCCGLVCLPWGECLIY